MAPGDYRCSSEDLLRQSDFVIVAVVVSRHLLVPLIHQLSFSSIKALAEATPSRRAGPSGALSGKSSSRLICRLVRAVEAGGDKRGSIPDQNFRYIGLLGAIIQLELFRAPFFGGGAKCGSDGIGVDKLLCKTALDQEKCERRSAAETPKGFLHVRLQG
jgi:hypothetical protein